ncbi:hypothetical protein LTR78_010751 [Recurvomyces mirabilis]|uniref:Apc15p protein-domain-containing protein n=1 Tax=Recurvomyces mirabilis TaxID=574656 RepID=A0AAE0WI39_9PEZI|nr:hypothetical protein LTR78_010751 [Recurvomyces mirabilis]KAK5155588.1 hypothetical protein LTS14_005849 [Recurvomyces mirabilis]
MLSLPLIPPTIDSSPILPTRFRPRPNSPPPANAAQNPQAARQLQQRRDEERKAHNTHSPLALLTTDENAIKSRKYDIQMFGHRWIRPPGVPKTLQAMHEEEVERREMEEQARQEQNMRDLQARQEVEEARERAERADEEGGEDEEEERDLDEDIPDADAEAEAEVSFNEESMVEGSSQFVENDGEVEDDEDVREAVEMEVAELTGAAREEEELGIDRDLDDSVPEAGSYQHTDTELEDSDDEESGLQDSFAMQSARRSVRVQQRDSRSARSGRQFQAQVQSMGGLQERMRAQVGAADALPRSPGSLNLSSSVLEGSFVGSSPVLQMQRGGHAQARGRSGRRGRMS